MPCYVKTALTQFHIIISLEKKSTHFPSVSIKYSAKKQYATQVLTAPSLGTHRKWFIQQVWGKYLFLGRSVNGIFLYPVNATTSQLAKPTDDTLAQKKATQLCGNTRWGSPHVQLTRHYIGFPQQRTLFEATPLYPTTTGLSSTVCTYSNMSWL